MPYEPLRCPTCGSTKTIAAENKRFYCASCDGWFVWAAATQVKETEPTPESIIALKQELRELKESLANKSRRDSEEEVESSFASKAFPDVQSSDPFFLHNDPGFAAATNAQASQSPNQSQGGYGWVIGAAVVALFVLVINLKPYESGNSSTSPINKTQTFPPRLVGRWKMKAEYTEKGLIKGARNLELAGILDYSQNLKLLRGERKKSLQDSTTFISIHRDGSTSQQILINGNLIDFGQFDSQPSKWVCTREDGRLLQIKSITGNSESQFEIEFGGPDFFELRHHDEETKSLVVKVLYLRVDEKTGQ